MHHDGAPRPCRCRSSRCSRSARRPSACRTCTATTPAPPTSATASSSTSRRGCAGGDDAGASARRGRRDGAAAGDAGSPRPGPCSAVARQRLVAPRPVGRPSAEAPAVQGSPKIELSRCWSFIGPGPLSVPGFARGRAQVRRRCRRGGLDPLAGRTPGAALGVEGGLEDEHRGRLVDHGALPPAGDPAVAQLPVGIHRGQPLVDEPHRHRGDPRREPPSVVAGQRGGRALLARTATAAARRPPRAPRAPARARRSRARSAAAARGPAAASRTGVASSPEGSLRRDARRGRCPRRPRAARRSRHRAQRPAVTRSPHRVLDPAPSASATLRRVGATALGHVVLAAAAAAEGLGRDLDQLTGPDAPLAGPARWSPR